MELNETIRAFDVAEARQGQISKLDVTSPKGEKYTVVCQPGHSLTGWS